MDNLEKLEELKKQVSDLTDLVKGDRKKKNEEAFIEFWKETNKRVLSNSENLDKWILTLSSGGIAISLTILSSVVDVSKALHLGFLFSSWGLFGTSILMTVISYFTGQKGLNKDLEYAKKFHIYGKREYANQKSWWSRVTKWLSWIYGFTFVSAIVFLILFTSVNLTRKGENMAKEEETQKEPAEKKGATSPEMLPFPNPDQSTEEPESQETTQEGSGQEDTLQGDGEGSSGNDSGEK